MTKQRKQIEQLVKDWAQSHTASYIIAEANENGADAIDIASGHFTWLIRTHNAGIDLQTLVDRLDIFLDMRKNRKHPDGTYCCKCGEFYQFAEPNQANGSLICYSCRTVGS